MISINIIEISNNIKNRIKNQIYLIIPIIITGLWLLYYLIHENFMLVNPPDGHKPDFSVYYFAGLQILEDPNELYFFQHNKLYYYYMPNVALFFLIFTLFDLIIAIYIFYILIYILAIFSFFEFNKILILHEIRKKSHRFLFLIIISNGFIIYEQFWWAQTKFIVLIIFLVIIRREIQFRIEAKNKNFKYYVINYSLFIFAIGFVPFFIFLLIIYVFHDKPFKELFKKNSLISFLLFILIFIAQNFLFVLYPNLIFIYISRGVVHDYSFELFYISDFISIYLINNTIMMAVVYFLICLISILTIILIFYQKLEIEQKFSYFSLFFLFLNSYKLYNVLILLFPFILLLFIPFLNQEVKKVDFLKKNEFVLLGLFSIFGVYLMIPYKETIYKYFPSLQIIPFCFIVYARYLIFFALMVLSLLILNYRKRKIKRDENLYSLTDKTV